MAICGALHWCWLMPWERLASGKLLLQWQLPRCTPRLPSPPSACCWAVLQTAFCPMCQVWSCRRFWLQTCGVDLGYGHSRLTAYTCGHEDIVIWSLPAATRFHCS